jgi:FkbM family methyltransferase
LKQPYPNKTASEMLELFIGDYLEGSGWMESVRTRSPLDKEGPVPWYTYPAIEFLKGIVDSRWKVLEFGCGHSSLWWAARCAYVCAVEHDSAYSQHIRTFLPGHAEVVYRPVNEPVESVLFEEIVPRLHFCVVKNYNLSYETRLARGMLNAEFMSYAAEILRRRNTLFDVIVVDGMARILTSSLAADFVSEQGIIVFDNSDREEYSPAYRLLHEKGFSRIDFWGPGPINPYQWCTSVFFKDLEAIQRKAPPSDHQNEVTAPGPLLLDGRTAAMKNRRGILVLAYQRPHHLQAVLESLRLQGVLDWTHVWIDGTHGRAELQTGEIDCKTMAGRFEVKEIRTHFGHLGIEKMMLDALQHMAGLYDSVLVLEDDCFPVEGGVELMFSELEKVQNDDLVFSVYGHHFEVPGEGDLITRFQGWGWASTSEKITAVMPEIKYLFSLSEREYLEYAEYALTDEIGDRLHVTPGREVINVLRRVFSWDSCLCLVTAKRKLVHKKTPTKAVYNFGLDNQMGHFRDRDKFLIPPFNMISIDRVWDHYATKVEDHSEGPEYYGLDELDRLIAEAIDMECGFFVELGAFDGKRQNNTLRLERRGWRGLLVEPVPHAYAKCVRNRPNSIVVNAACVSADYDRDYLDVYDVGLMSIVPGAMPQELEQDWLSRGEGFHGKQRQLLSVRAKTLSRILDDHKIDHIDLLILDVEGYELQVLKGLDFATHAPTYIVAEDQYDDAVQDFLSGNGFRMTKVLLERQHTRDVLYTKVA